MKIAIIADSLDNQNAGVHQYTRSLIDALAKKENRKHEYILIRQKKDPHLPFRQIIIKNIRLPIGFASLRLFFIIPFLLRKYKVDVVFEPAHFGPFNLPERIKRVTMIHDLTPIKFPHYHKWHSQFLQKIFLPRILKKADLVLSNSKSTTKDILGYRNLNEEKIKTILLGRDEFYKPISSRNELEKIKLVQPYFLAVGTIEPRKNLSLLLEAFGIFKQEKKSDVRLVIAGGNGWKTEMFYKELNRHPNKNDIRVLGFVTRETLRELYSHAICLVYSSLYEGFGFPILESMSCGTHVISFHRSSMPEVGGDKAFYFYENEARELEELMRGIYQGEIAGSALGLIRQSELFSWKKYAEVFEDIMSDNLKI